VVGGLAQHLHIRPSDLVEFHGSVYERLLFDAECLYAAQQEVAHANTTRGRMMARRAKEWPPDMIR